MRTLSQGMHSHLAVVMQIIDAESLHSFMQSSVVYCITALQCYCLPHHKADACRHVLPK